nr:TRNA (guanosine(18)-2'-O)-methyltransferase [Ipomoea batatas]GMC99357.1 TRNA (guanosine(18)-2'-O)-methyltransferase [Ipomoea batatas]
MSACKTLVRTSLSCLECRARVFAFPLKFPSFSPHLCRLLSPSRRSLILYRNPGSRIEPHSAIVRRYGCSEAAISLETDNNTEESSAQKTSLQVQEDLCRDTVEELLTKRNDVSRFMKMERRQEVEGDVQLDRWFPYLDKFNVGSMCLSSSEVLEAMDPYIMEARKERFRKAVKNRTYSVCLVVEGLSDFGNVSAAFRSADALGFQSVHVISCNSSKRYRDNRHVSMGAEKWLDIELWDSPYECFKVLKSRGYRIATTHLGMDAVSVYDMDWSCPTAVVVGNENRGISDEALELSDMHCSIPMKGMVDSFNVSVAAGILMHHAVCDRTSRMGCHGDLTLEESQILLAEFSLRHSNTAISIANEYAKRKIDRLTPKL